MDQPTTYGPGSKHTRRILFNMLKKIDFKSVLDLGCGDGSFIKHLLDRRPDLSVTGIDISKNAIKIANKIAKKNTSCNFYVMDITKELPQNKFDLVVCSEVLEHLKEDSKLLYKFSNLTKYIIISVPSGKFNKIDKEVGHLRKYNKKDLRLKLSKANFKILKIKKWGFPFYSPLYVFFFRKLSKEKRTGKISFTKKIISSLISLIFYFNILNKGDRLFILAVNNKTNKK